MNKLNLIFTVDKETRHTYRYAEEGDAGIVKTIYISKRDLGNPVPQRIHITIEPVDMA